MGNGRTELVGRLCRGVPPGRGYDPLPLLPVMAGRVVESLDVSERFLWDLRQTAQELIVQHHAWHLRELAGATAWGFRSNRMT